MIDWWTGMDLEEDDRGLNEVLSRNLPWQTEENHDNS